MSRKYVNFVIYNDEGDVINESKIISFPEDYWKKFDTFDEFKQEVDDKIKEAFARAFIIDWDREQLHEFIGKFENRDKE